jgi:diaminopimelate epimerase
MRFTKMHALGNDFIVIDSRGPGLKEPESLARRLCRRRFGIGADQMLVLEDPSSADTADFRMHVYNADGSEVEMCGNGIRCIAKYVWDRGLAEKDTLEIETLAGIIRPGKAEGGMVKVDMGEPVLEGRQIPVGLDGRVMDYPLEAENRTFHITCVSMGNPHAVIFTDNLDELPVERYGPIIENHGFFPNRTNVEFIEVKGPEDIRMRVWERGAGETMACGTGASASAVASSLKGLTGRKVTVHLAGGDLFIEWAGDNHVYMTGPATEVFEGEIKT